MPRTRQLQVGYSGFTEVTYENMEGMHSSQLVHKSRCIPLLGSLAHPNSPDPKRQFQVLGVDLVPS